MHGAAEQMCVLGVVVVEGPPRSPCTGRWAARNPNEKWLPKEANQAGGGLQPWGGPCGRVVVCPAGGWQSVRLSKGGRGKMVVQNPVKSVHVALREVRRAPRNRSQNAN